MPVCPACETENPPAASVCRQCGLAAELFEPIRAAVGLPKGDPRYESQVRELIAAMGDLATVPSDLGDPDPVPARFPPGAPEPPGTPLKLSIEQIPKRPALPTGSPPAELRQHIDESLRIGRRIGLDESRLLGRARELARIDTPEELERFASDLFVRVAAALTESYGRELSRRDEWTAFVPTPSIDEGLLATRTALERGDLAGAEATLRTTTERLDRLEEEWGPCEVLLLGAQDLADEVRALGGDPLPALGPIEEARRWMRDADREGAETLLARGILGLWSLLNPLLEKDLARRIEEVRAHKQAGANVDAVLTDLREFGRLVKIRNFSAAVAFYRRGVNRLTALGSPEADPAPSLNSEPSVPPV